MNTKAIKSLAIVTAFHQLAWTPGTSFYECWTDEFVASVKEQATANLEWAEFDHKPYVTAYDIANAIWGMDRDQYKESLEELA